jgi:proteasome lid subunit RPN8/RPN11
MDAGGRKIAEEIYPISNAREETARRNRFLIAPEEFLRGEKYARGTRRDVIGIYHSHPDHPAHPSQFDLDHAWPIYSYVIVSVHKGQAAELLSWELASDRTRFNHEEISKGN